MRLLASLFFFIILSFQSVAQTSIWFEQFNYADGTTESTSGPTQWTTDVSAATLVPPNDYFEVRPH